MELWLQLWLHYHFFDNFFARRKKKHQLQLIMSTGVIIFNKMVHPAGFDEAKPSAGTK